MAIVKLVKYKIGGNASPSAMRAVINYCLQPFKTEDDEQVTHASGVNCTPQFCYDEFMTTKHLHGKAAGVFFYHYVQSFPPDEDITPAEANAIGLEFAKEAWDGYEVLVATHRDANHIHTHFIVNSVGIDSGLKLHQPPTTLKQLREISDRICIKYGKSILPPPKKAKTQGIGSGEYHKAAQGDSWKFRLSLAINKAMDISGTKEEFIQNMKRQGYDVLWTDERKHITYTCLREPKYKDGKYKKARDKSLHEEKFLKENMEEEFYAREQLFKTADTRGADEASRAEANNDSYTADRGADTHGAAFRGTMGADGDSDRRTVGRESGTETGAFSSEGAGAADGESRNEEGVGGTDGGNRENNRGARSASQRTGWEGSRESYKKYRMGMASGFGSVGAKPRSHGSANHLGFDAGNLYGLASAVSIIENDEETEEERLEREARNAGSALGLAAGTAIGIYEAIKASKEQTIEQSEDSAEEDNTQDFTISM